MAKFLKNVNREIFKCIKDHLILNNIKESNKSIDTDAKYLRSKLLALKEKGEVISVAEANKLCNNISVLKQISKAQQYNDCVNQMTELIVAKSKAIQVFYTKSSKPVANKPFFPVVVGARCTCNGRNECTVCFQASVRDEYKKEFVERVQNLVAVKAIEQVNQTNIDLQ